MQPKTEPVRDSGVEPSGEEFVWPPAPSDAENVESLKSSVDSLRKTAGDGKGPGAVASRRLADGLSKLAGSNQATRDKAQNIFVSPLKVVFDELKNALQAAPVTLSTLPPSSRWAPNQSQTMPEGTWHSP